MIEHVDKIIDLRRHLVLMEASFPKELKQTFKNLESKGNPWGLPTKDRAKWADGLDIPLLADKPDAEYVFWVGCAGAYDERQKKVSRALVNLLREANVSFAILGNDEGCTGDPARRAGNEYLFQQQATANVEMMNGAGLAKKKLVTHCPHCFNTIKNEYPQFGGQFQIVHHSVLIEELVRTGRIKPKNKPEGVTRVTSHDSGYIGRYNDVYEQPRSALTAIPGLELKEMARNRTTGMCCGAGGARVWMEEHRGARINHTRVEQAMETQADTIAVACPFCNLMMEDGIGAKQVAVKAKDVAELVWESLGKG
jgi:Fe-S oxidoreductase